MRSPRLVTGARLRYDEVREEHLLLIPEGAVRLNPTAAEVLELCDGERSLEDIVGALSERYQGADVREDVVELDPQHLGLEAQRGDGGVLLLGRPTALDREVERVLRVPRRLDETGPEVLQAGGVDPPVVAFERVEPHADRSGPEELGERRRDGLDPWLGAREGHVGVDGVAHGGQDAPLGRELVARDAEGLPQPQPRLDATGALGGAVVVDDALDPFTAMVAVRHVGKNCSVLDRNADLVVEAVVDPALHLFAGAFAAVHGDVKRVMNVIAVTLGA